MSVMRVNFIKQKLRKINVTLLFCVFLNLKSQYTNILLRIEIVATDKRVA